MPIIHVRKVTTNEIFFTHKKGSTDGTAGRIQNCGVTRTREVVRRGIYSQPESSAPQQSPMLINLKYNTLCLINSE